MSETAVVEGEVGGEAGLFVRAFALDEGALVGGVVHEAASFVVVEGGAEV